MGMFDYVRCKYPLPKGAPVDGYQTKDTEAQWLDTYEIREDGSLWHQDYDIEERSDPNAEGLMRMVGCMTPVNKRWVAEPMTGEITFYDDQWQFSAYFVRGQLKHLETIVSPGTTRRAEGGDGG